MAQLTNTVSGTVTTDGTTPLAGVTVTASPGAETTTTDATGAFSFMALPVGAYQMTFTLSGYTTESMLVGVSTAGPTKVAVVMPINLDGAAGPTVAVTDQLDVGFGAPVSITATATGNVGDGGTLTYAWTQTGGAPVTLSGASTATLSFTTPNLVTSLGYLWPDGITDGGISVSNARCGVRGVDRDQANHSTFQLVVTDGYGLKTTTSVQVFSTRPTTGLRNVPALIPVWLEGNGPSFPLDSGLQASWNWQLTSKPNGSNAALYAANGAPGSTYSPGAAGQYAYFVPDVPGTYTLTEATAQPACSVTVYAGTWEGIMTVTGPNDKPNPVSVSTQAKQCGQCHTANPLYPWPGSGAAPDMFSLWEGTNHASALQRKIEGSAGPHFGESCLECHTLGYDKTAVNGGFDDLEVPNNWKYPATNKSPNWDNLESLSTAYTVGTAPVTDNTDLADLAGIQCENCHGPQNTEVAAHGLVPTDPSSRISWSEQVCASCHEEYGNHYKPSQWAEQGPSGPGAHSNRALAVSEGGGGSDHCSRCHSAQGYQRYAFNLPGGYYGYLTSDGNPLDPTYASSPSTAKNTPATAAQLMPLGMNPQSVEPQTCQACHDPHNAANPNQLRVYDGVPALPNGLTNIAGMGNGMVCATCHNSRNGEHTDYNTQITQSVNTSTTSTPAWTSTGVMVNGPLASFTTPHTPSQTDVYFGFNAYFGARNEPSPHMAVGDSCAGCHYAAPTATQTALKETSNHSFVVDSTVCSNCHAANVDGVALQSANKAQLDSARNLWASKLLTNLNNAINAAGVTVKVTALDPTTGYANTAKGVVLPAPSTVTSIAWANVGVNAYSGFDQSTGLTLTLSSPISVTFVTPSGTALTPVNLSSLTVGLSGFSTNASIPNTGGTSGNKAAFFTPWVGGVEWTTTGPVAELPPWVNGDIQTLIKAYWNLQLLNNDNTFGIHNPPFYNDVIQHTSTALEAVQ